jgi:hypothetical protein
MELRFFDDPTEFLALTGDHLAGQPVVSTVVSSVADRIARDREAGVPWPEGIPCWFVAVLERGEVTGAAMRTAPFGTFPLFVLPMTDDAARRLAEALLDRGESVGAANGALPATRIFCDHVAARTQRTVEVAVHTRLFELDQLVEPQPVDGRCRPARPDEEGLVLPWYAAFMSDADQQAGRSPGSSAHEAPATDVIRRNIADERVFVWENGDGRPVSLVAASRPSYGVSRIGPVYTPPGERGKGYASNAVAEVSRAILAAGARACLFTDQANPTSNKIYQALGYRPVVDMAQLVLNPVRP